LESERFATANLIVAWEKTVSQDPIFAHYKNPVKNRIKTGRKKQQTTRSAFLAE
jgi:hypothetical protein